MTPSLPGLVRPLHFERCHLLQILDGKIQTLLVLSKHYELQQQSNNTFYLFFLERPLELLQQGLDGVQLSLAEGAAEPRHDGEVPGASLALTVEHEPALEPLLTFHPTHCLIYQHQKVGK